MYEENNFHFLLLFQLLCVNRAHTEHVSVYQTKNMTKVHFWTTKKILVELRELANELHIQPKMIT